MYKNGEKLYGFETEEKINFSDQVSKFGPLAIEIT